MTDIAIEVEALDENHVSAMLWLSRDLTAGAGAELRPLPEQSASRTNTGLSASELVLTGLLSATTVRPWRRCWWPGCRRERSAG